MASQYHIHFINPHLSAEHHDTVCEGFSYGLWAHPYPAGTPHLYEFQSKNKRAARTLQRQLHEAGAAAEGAKQQV